MESTYQLDNKIFEMNITLDEAFKNLRKFKTEAKKRVPLKGTHQLTARYIINFFVREWDKRSVIERKKGFYIDTKNTSLATLCDCEKETIINHIKRLIQANIIEKKERTGCGIRIWVNPKAIINFSFLDMKKTHPLVPRTFVKEERTKGGVNNFKNEKNLVKNTKEQHSAESKSKESWSLMKGSVCCSELASRFWDHSRKYIYPDLQFSKNRERALKELLEKNIVLCLKGEKGKPVDLYFKLTAYLDRARKWFKDHPEVIPPDPYHFFSMEDYGFRFWKLIEYDNHRKKESINQSVKRRIRSECLKFSQGSHDSILSLFKRHLEMVKNANCKDLSNWFISKSHSIYSV